MSKVAACGVTSATFHNVCFGMAALRKHGQERLDGEDMCLIFLASYKQHTGQ